MKFTKPVKLSLGGFALTFLALTSAAVAGVNKISFASQNSTPQTAKATTEFPQVSKPLAQAEEPKPITNTSGDSEIALAKHLKSLNAKMYGAYWCPYCHAQEEMFGQEAFEYINYIECDPRGKDAQPQLCKAANIKGYPTWEINNKFYPGVKSLQELAKISGYTGTGDFKNQFIPPDEK